MVSGQALLLSEGQAVRPGLRGLTCQGLFPHLQNGRQLCWPGRSQCSGVVPKEAASTAPDTGEGSRCRDQQDLLIHSTWMELTVRG